MELERYWDFNNLPATRARFDALLETVRTEGRADEAASILTQIARIDGLEGDIDAAHAALEQARALAPDDPPEARVRILLETGRIARDQGEATAAEGAFDEARSMARAAGLDALALDALHMQAIAAPPDKARALALEAEAMIAQCDPALRGWLGPILNNLGWTLFEARQHDAALECFRRDSVLRADLGAVGERQIADWNAGFVLRHAGRLNEARVLQDGLEKEIGPTGAGIAFVYEELAELAHAAGETSAARDYAEKARQAHLHDGLTPEADPAKFARLEGLRGRGAEG